MIVIFKVSLNIWNNKKKKCSKISKCIKLRLKTSLVPSVVNANRKVTGLNGVFHSHLRLKMGWMCAKSEIFLGARVRIKKKIMKNHK